MATQAEKKAAAALANEKPAATEPVIAAPELTPEEEAQLEADSKKVQEDLAKKQAEKDALREKAAEATGERMYSKAEVQAMLKQLSIDMKKDELVNEDDEEAYKTKQLRLPRFQNKFITKFKNMNTDEYFPDLVISSFDVFDDKTRQNVPWVTAVFEDGTELAVPLNTVFDRSTKVWVDIVEVISKDTSYSAGKTERAEYNDYTRSGTGAMVNMKVKQAEYTYKVRLPGTGKEVEVTRDVINW